MNKKIILFTIIFGLFLINISVAFAVIAAPSPTCEITANILKIEKKRTDIGGLGQPPREDFDYYSVNLNILNISTYKQEGERFCDDPYSELAEKSWQILTIEEFNKNPILKGQKIKAKIHFGGDEWFGGFFLSDIQILEGIPKEESLNKEFCTPKGAGLATWNNQKYITINEPPKKYLDAFRNKFIELGLSKKYFDDKFKLIAADMFQPSEQKDITYIEAFYKINTNSWIDNYINGGGYSMPSVCRNIYFIPEPTLTPGIKKNEETEKLCFDVCEIDKFPMALRSRIKIYHDENETIYILGPWSTPKAHLNEITNIISEKEAKLLAKKCVSDITSGPIIKLGSWGDEKTWRVIYRVNGDVTETVKQANVDLATGDVECREFPAVVYEGSEDISYKEVQAKDGIKQSKSFLSKIIDWIKSLFS